MTTPVRAARVLVMLLVLGLLVVGCSDSTDQAQARKDSGPRPAPTTEPAPPTTVAGATAGSAGAAGVGDPYFPDAGNGGYDVASYDVVTSVRIEGEDQLDATTTIRATATQDLTSFNLDLLGFEVGTVTVDGAGATASRDGRELTVTPATPLRSGAEFTVVVAYAGTPGQLQGPGSFLEDGGWVELGDDYAAVIAEPDRRRHLDPVQRPPVGQGDVLADRDRPRPARGGLQRTAAVTRATTGTRPPSCGPPTSRWPPTSCRWWWVTWSWWTCRRRAGPRRRPS